MSQIFDFFESISNHQINQSNLAIRCSGDYDVSDFYIRFRIQPKVWFNLTTKTQENKLKGFLNKNIFELDNITNLKNAVKEKNNQRKQKKNKNKKINSKNKPKDETSDVEM